MMLMAKIKWVRRCQKGEWWRQKSRKWKEKDIDTKKMLPDKHLRNSQNEEKKKRQTQKY